LSFPTRRRAATRIVHQPAIGPVDRKADRPPRSIRTRDRSRIALRNRRAASAFSRSRRSDGFSYERRHFISRKASLTLYLFLQNAQRSLAVRVAANYKFWQEKSARIILEYNGLGGPAPIKNLIIWYPILHSLGRNAM
jgi:hypothetical protein